MPRPLDLISAFLPSLHLISLPFLFPPLSTVNSSSHTMSKPSFWSTPLRYWRWASHERPAYFWSILIGSMGPVAMFTVPPIRRYFGDVDPEPIPLSYPSMSNCLPHFLGQLPKSISLLIPPHTVPKGPRVIPQGYDDE